VDSESYASGAFGATGESGATAEAGEPALANRLEALMEQAASSEGSELPVGPVLAASLTGLRAELSGMREDLAALRADQAQRVEDAVEERLAAIEDTLDGLAERLEAQARVSATNAVEQISSVDDRLAALSQSVSSERTTAAQHREKAALAMQDQGAALDEWAEAVRAGLEDLGEAVTNSLGTLGNNLHNTAAREADRRHLEALVTELTTTIDEAFAAMGEQVITNQHPIEEKLAAVHEDVLDGFGGARARLVEELSGTITSLEQANSATRQTVEAELVDLRGDLADALEEVRERVEGTVGEANTSIAATLAEHQAANEEMRAGIGAAATHSQDSNKRVRGLAELVEQLDGTLADLQSDWRPRVDAVVAEGRASAQGVLAEMHGALEATLEEMRTTMAAQQKTIRDISGTLGGGTERLIAAGQALVAYLAERDRWLEAERDRVLHEVLDEFAEGLSAKERKAVSSRVGEALDRRRDVRDAQRYRRGQEGRPAVDVPPIPAELTELNEPVVPVLPRSSRRTSTRLSTAAAAPKAAAKSRSKSTPRKTTTASSGRPASAAKTPAKSTKKTTAKATPRKRSTS
jgi:hypothetical protein